MPKNTNVNWFFNNSSRAKVEESAGGEFNITLHSMNEIELGQLALVIGEILDEKNAERAKTAELTPQERPRSVHSMIMEE